VAAVDDALNVVVVGPGRLGRSAAALLASGSHRVRLVGRGDRIPSAPITWLTVPDRAIADAAALVPPGGVLLHASGATDLEVLRPRRPVGSLHPLMSFPGPDVGMPRPEDGIPAALAGDPKALTAGRLLASALGFSPFEVPGDRRLYHASAVLAGNFATALLADAARILAAAGVPEEQAPALLAPLALASIRNAAAAGPATALTGPVSRGDDGVIDGHLSALDEAGMPPGVRATYQVLLESARRLRRTKD
jgi:predicted short-subunit dehydrogenase-like oxidoreductase (DUF2520 family)